MRCSRTSARGLADRRRPTVEDQRDGGGPVSPERDEERACRLVPCVERSTARDRRGGKTPDLVRSLELDPDDAAHPDHRASVVDEGLLVDRLLGGVPVGHLEVAGQGRTPVRASLSRDPGPHLPLAALTVATSRPSPRPRQRRAEPSQLPCAACPTIVDPAAPSRQGVGSRRHVRSAGRRHGGRSWVTLPEPPAARPQVVDSPCPLLQRRRPLPQR